GLAVLERLQRDSALDQLRLEHVEDGLDPVFAVGLHLNRLAAPGDRGIGAAEVVAGVDLLRSLVEGVVGLLTIDLADDVEGGFAGHGCAFVFGDACPDATSVTPDSESSRGASDVTRVNRVGDSGSCLVFFSGAHRALTAADCPSGQRELTVNQPALPSKVRILHLPRRTERPRDRLPITGSFAWPRPVRRSKVVATTLFRGEAMNEEAKDEQRPRLNSLEDRNAVVESAVDRAVKRGDFDDLPGLGRPLKGLGNSEDPDW